MISSLKLTIVVQLLNLCVRLKVRILRPSMFAAVMKLPKTPSNQTLRRNNVITIIIKASREFGNTPNMPDSFTDATLKQVNNWSKHGGKQTV